MNVALPGPHLQVGEDRGLWETLVESFDEKLPRRTAIALKPSDRSIVYAYPSPLGTIGWCFDDRLESTYDEQAAFRWFLAPWLNRGVAGRPVAQTTFVWEHQEYRPDLVRRRAVYSDNGLVVAEQFGRAVEDGFTWQLSFGNRALQAYDRSIYLVLEARRGLGGVSREGDVFRAAEVSVAGPAVGWGTYDHWEEAEQEVMAGRLTSRANGGRYLVLELPVKIDSYGAASTILGLSFRDAETARQAAALHDLAGPIRERWNAWLRTLPRAEFRSAEEARLYYKCWWVVRLNYYTSPRYGHLVCEALPVYRGYWLSALDAAEWHSDQDTHETSVHIHRALDLFLEHQRADGYITHAIYLDEAVPGERWSRQNLTQTPHIAWVALRYAECTGDQAALARWYPRLVKFYDYLCATRDHGFRNLHLWAILASYDAGLDTTAVFQKVTYGVDGVRERHCYPAVYGAERCRYEQALARMAEILGTGEQAHWLDEAERTRRALVATLWDPARQWYGVLHEDGALDTRVGVDGLFPLAYGLAEAAQAAAARRNFERLIDRYGVHTMAPGELGYEAMHYWRGPAWPKSCALGVAVARNYFPDLLEEVVGSTLRMLGRWPSVWECLVAETGEVARGDQGLCATPLISSNVGAGAMIGALLSARGVDMMAFDGVLPLAPMRNFHWAGLRLDLLPGDGRWTLVVRGAERERSTLRLRRGNGETIVLAVRAGETCVL